MLALRTASATAGCVKVESALLPFRLYVCTLCYVRLRPLSPLDIIQCHRRRMVLGEPNGLLQLQLLLLLLLLL